MTDFLTVSLDQLAEIAAVPDDLRILASSPGGPLQRVSHDRLLTKLIATDLVFANVAALGADLAHGADTVALVHNDPDPLLNGWYRKTGASGAGAWVQFETLAMSVKDAAETAAAAAIAAAAEAIAAVSSAGMGATFSVTAAEAIAAGKFVHVLGDDTCVLADATDETRWATAFAPVAIALGEEGIVSGLGMNAAVAVAAFGAEVYLDPASPGGFTVTLPNAESGAKFIQILGMAKPGVGIVFTPQARVPL